MTVAIVIIILQTRFWPTHNGKGNEEQRQDGYFDASVAYATTYLNYVKIKPSGSDPFSDELSNTCAITGNWAILLIESCCESACECSACSRAVVSSIGSATTLMAFLVPKYTSA